MSSSMLGMLITWGVFTGVLIVLLIYRNTLTIHEDDQLFLSSSEAHLEQEQVEIHRRVDKINPFVRWLGAASCLLMVGMAGLALYERWQLTQ